ncbi:MULTISPECIES: phage tail tape measure protein [Streptomyces]|uniref:phage tail tape measure protein n=1 Tax=Streptomyces TaxID=1883 RepID=UPI000B9E0F2D|nr:phage tail tape measure protein [Streptomyces kasugaensis]
MSGTANAMRAGAAYIELQARADRLLSDVQRQARQAGLAAGATLSTTMSQRMTAMGSKLSAVGSTMSRSLTLPLVGAGAAVIKMGSDFQYQMERVRNISLATGGDFDMMKKQAKDLGATTQFSATQAAQGMEFLAMAGFKPKEIYQAMPAVLNGASAANMDLGQTANIVSNIMTGFGLSADKATTATDILTKASQKGNVDVEGLGESFKYGGSMAKMAGLSIEETASAFTLMGNAGMQGSMGGTAVGAALRSMMKPSRFAKKEMDALGLSFQTADGKLKPLPDIIDAVGKSGMTNEQFLRIFGTEGGRAMSALAEQGSGAMRTLTKELEGARGTTDRFAQNMSTTAKAGMQGFTSALEGLAIAISESGVLDGFTKILGAVTGFVRKLTETNPTILKWGFTLLGVTAAIGPLLKVGGALFGWVGKLGPAISAVTMAVRGLNLAFLANPIGLVVAAIAALAVGIVVAYKKFAPFREAVDRLWSALKAAFSALMTALQPVFDALKKLFAQIVTSGGEMWTQIQPILSQLGTIFKAVFDGIVLVVRGFVSVVQFVWDRWGEQILGMVRGVWTVIGSVIKGALGVIQGIIQVVTALIAGDWSGVWEGIQKILSSVWGMIKGVISGALEYIKNLMSIVWDGISSLTSKVWNGILEFIRSIPGRVVSFFMNWSIVGLIIRNWESIKSGTVRAAGGMLSYVSSLPGRIVGFFGDFGSMLYGKGTDLVRGLWRGIQAMGAWLRNTLMGWARNMIPGPIADALGIRSPSRLMRDKIGKFIPAGVVAGIDAGRPAIRKAMRTLVPQPSMPGIPDMAVDRTADEPKRVTSFRMPTLVTPNLRLQGESSRQREEAGVARSGAGVTVYAETNADPAQIGREVAWAVRTQR